MPRSVGVDSRVPGGHSVWRQVSIVLAVAVLIVGVVAPCLAADKIYHPGIVIALEVRTPQGNLRTFQRPGARPSYWDQGMPVVQGDVVTVTPLINTGGAELGTVTIRLDQNPLVVPEGPGPRVQINTASLAAGYHSVEVWATTKGSKRGEGDAAATFLVVPATDPLLQALNGDVAPGPAVSDEERLAVAIKSLDPRVDRELVAEGSANITGDTLFSISGGPVVKEYFYTLSRDGAVSYTSPRLPISTQVLIGPPARETPGVLPGKVIFTVRGGDGAGHFGAPAWVTLNIAPSEAPK